MRLDKNSHSRPYEAVFAHRLQHGQFRSFDVNFDQGGKLGKRANDCRDVMHEHGMCNVAGAKITVVSDAGRLGRATRLFPKRGGQDQFCGPIAVRHSCLMQMDISRLGEALG